MAQVGDLQELRPRRRWESTARVELGETGETELLLAEEGIMSTTP